MPIPKNPSGIPKREDAFLSADQPTKEETRALLTEVLAIKFDPKVVKEAARVAARKGITRAGLIRMYVQEGLARDRE